MFRIVVTAKMAAMLLVISPSPAYAGGMPTSIEHLVANKALSAPCALKCMTEPQSASKGKVLL